MGLADIINAFWTQDDWIFVVSRNNVHRLNLAVYREVSDLEREIRERAKRIAEFKNIDEVVTRTPALNLMASQLDLISVIYDIDPNALVKISKEMNYQKLVDTYFRIISKDFKKLPEKHKRQIERILRIPSEFIKAATKDPNNAVDVLIKGVELAIQIFDLTIPPLAIPTVSFVNAFISYIRRKVREKQGEE